jgi:hypothetical protein
MSRFVFLSLAALGACASAEIRPMDRYFVEGRYEEVVGAFEADSSLWSDEDAVYQVAVARSLPDSPVYDPARARDLLDQFLTRFPDSERWAEIRYLSALVEEIMRVQEEADGLEAEAAALSERVASLKAEVSEQARVIEEARAEIRRRDVELWALRQELQRLKAIDLRLNPSDSAS